MPISPEEVISLRKFFIEELQENGYNDIVQQVNTRLLRDKNQQELTNQPYNLLMYYIDEACNILKSVSNVNYRGLLDNLNASISGEEQAVTSLSVQGIGPDNEAYYDLSAAPNYTKLITLIREIQSDIQNQNELP